MTTTEIELAARRVRRRFETWVGIQIAIRGEVRSDDAKQELGRLLAVEAKDRT